jgi:ABC-type branched-subunit amino acid transport system ATPase component/branched-subunit amino acid ABC-type transport system permease component
MQEFLPFIVIGIATGAVYGLAGVGLVLAYKTSGIFNLAYGAIAALTVFVFYWLHDEHGWPWGLAAIVCIFVIGPAEGLLMELLGRALERVGATLKVVATVGLLLMVLGVGELWYGNNEVNFPPFLPTSTVPILGVNVGWDQITVTIISLIATAVLYWFFRFVRMGYAMRGVVDNPDLLSMTGENPIRVRRWAWIISMTFCSMAGLLLAPGLSLNAVIISTLVVYAFGAAAIGGFSSLPLTFLGGLLVGIAGSLATKYSGSITWLSGLPPAIPFIVLFLALCVTPKAKLAERRVVTTLPVKKSWYAPWRVRGATFAGGLVILCLIPNLVGDDLAIWASFLADAILLLSLGLLVRVSGQISLCHLAFAAVGAAAFAHFTDSYHLPWLLALLFAMLVALPVGAIVSIPAIRLSGLFLALATLGFGILLQYLFYSTNLMFGLTTSGIPAPRPDVSIFGLSLASDKGFYYVLLVAAVISTAVIMVIQRSRLGRLLGALADSPLALETQGATTNVIKVLVFCLSAAFASLAGALIAIEFHYAVGANYDPFQSLVYVALVVIAIGGEPWYALLAALGVSIIPGYFTSNNVTTYLQIFFGVLAAVYVIFESRTATVPLRVRQFLDRLGGRQPEETAVTERVQSALVDAATSEEIAANQDSGLAAAAASEARVVETPAATIGLEVRGLSVRFGGVSAVREVSLTAPMGSITGLVGPNGAGKTTTFNACSGLVKPSDGKILLHGRDVTSLGPSGRSRFGLGRSFQRVELFSSLTVRENVALGREASLAGANPARQLVSSTAQRATVRRAVEDAIELTGIGPLGDLQAGLLPTGQRRMVELARVLAGPFDLFLLDEPSSGLDAMETRRFGNILTGAVAERGVGILLVEHDMALVRQVCENIYVLDFGQMIFEGTAAEMLASPIVRNAYLGSGDGMTEDAVPGASVRGAVPSVRTNGA